MNALSYYQQLAQFLLTIKTEIPLVCSSKEEQDSILACIDNIYSLTQEQLISLQDVKR